MAEMVDSISDAVERGMEDVAGVASAAKSRLTDAESQARTFIQEYPLGALAAAVVAGYVIARLVPRV